MFSCEFYEIFKNTFFTEQLQWLFLNSASLLLSFLEIEPEMLLKCSLLHKDIFLPRRAVCSIFVFMSTSRSVSYLCFLFSITIFIFIINSLRQTVLFFGTFLSKVQSLGVFSFCLIFCLVLLLKVFLIKKCVLCVFPCDIIQSAKINVWNH